MPRLRHDVLVAEDISLRKAVIPVGVDEFRDGPEIVLVVPGLDLDREDRFSDVVELRQERGTFGFLFQRAERVMDYADYK